MWDLSCPDWERRLRGGRSLVPELPFLDVVAADRALEVFKALRLHDVPGNPAQGDAGSEWFWPIVRAIAGSVVDGERMIREQFTLVPKKNSKTTDSALLMLSASLLCYRPRAEFIFVGPTQEIADLGFQSALGAVLLDENLKKRIRIQEHLKRLTVRKTGVKLQIKTFGPKILTGSKPSGGVLMDEVHLLGDMASAESTLLQLRGGMQPYPEAFLMMISTQSERAPAGIFRKELIRARKTRDGLLKGRLLPVLYEFAEEMLRSGAWKDPRVWHWLNPMLGRSLTLKGLIEAYEEAEREGEGEFKRWCSQHLNVEIGVGLGSDHWVGARFWERNADETLRSLDELLERCEVAVIGLDGGGLDDLFGVAVVGRERETRRWLTWHKAFAHRETLSAGADEANEAKSAGVLDRRKAIAARLMDFEKEGTLEWYEKPGDELEKVIAIVLKVRDAGLLPAEHAIGVDRAGITEVVDALVKLGFTVESEEASGAVVGIRQGWELINTIKTTERRLANETLLHAGTSLMDWCVGNAKVVPSGNAYLITKQAAGVAKIDPLMAMFNANALMAKNPVASAAIPEDYNVPVWA